MLLICLALRICSAAKSPSVKAAAMLRAVNHYHESTASSRKLDDMKDQKALNTPEWPDDDDEISSGSQKKDSTKDSNVFEQQNVDHTGKNNGITNGENAASEAGDDFTKNPSTKPKQVVPIGQDNAGDDDEIIKNENVDSSVKQQQISDAEKTIFDTDEIDTNVETKGRDNTTFVIADESPSTEYHRSQSTTRNEALEESTGEIRSFNQHDDQLAAIAAGNTNNIDNGGDSNMATVQKSAIENSNNEDNIVPAVEQFDQLQQSQLDNNFAQNYNEDDEEESFFGMIQSTLQVIVLAAFLALGLVFRRRVQDRMIEHPSLSTAHAIKDEAIKVVIELATRLSETQNESNRIVGGRYALPTVVERDSSVGTSGSRGETIPLATATDEEWGWDDDNVGENLELSDVAGDTSNEDDDLAMAIAMSLSESGRCGSSETGCPADVVIKSSLSAPTTVVEKSSIGNDQLSPPADNIEDLLGQMSNGDGPVIRSLGQVPRLEPKSNTKTKRNDSTDDIFESMGLSSFPTKAGPSQQQMSTPSSTLLKTELMEEMDDCDDWGDDGDLDDLLLED
ncbi:hypothetical protein ACHAXM_003718 [Skeletonema potamos]